jgi:hypothetical protein
MALPAWAVNLIQRFALGGDEGADENATEGMSTQEVFRYINNGIKDTSSAMDRLSVSMETLNVPGALGGVMKSGVDLAFTFEKLNIGLGQSTGLVPHLTTDFLELTRQSSHLGMSMEETARVTGELALGMKQYPVLTKNVRIGLAKVAAELKQVGVNTRDSARAFDIFTSALRRTPEAAGASMESIHLLAQQVGRSTAQVMSDFNRMAPQLLKYGDSYETVFGKLQKSARAYHMEASEVLRVTDAFDTFEGAAQKVGALNSVFGRYGVQLNDIALMEMDEAERLEYISEQFKNAGVEVSELSRRQRQFLAAQLTGGDQDLLARMLGPRAEYDDYMQSQEELSTTAVRMTDSIQTAQGAVQRFVIDAGGMERGAAILEKIAGSFSNIARDGAGLGTYIDDYVKIGGLLKLQGFINFFGQAGLKVKPGATGNVVNLLEGVNQAKENRPKPANDLFVPGAQMGGKYVIGPEGTFSLNNKDSIIAGTDLGGPSAKEIQKAVMTGVREALKAGGQRQPIEISLDGRVVGRAVTDFINQEYNLYTPV